MFGRKIVKENEWKNLNQSLIEAKTLNNQLMEKNQRLEMNLKLMWKDNKCDTTKLFKAFQEWLIGDPEKGIKGKLPFPCPTFVFKDFIRDYKKV